MKHCLGRGRENGTYPPRRILGSRAIYEYNSEHGNSCMSIEPYSVIRGTDVACITPSSHSRNIHQMHETYIALKG